MTTLDALAALPARLAGDEIHVAFIVTIDFDALPHLWVADRNGKPHPITAFRKHDDETESRPAAWSFADLALAAQYIDHVRQEVRFSGSDFRDAHDKALSRIAWLRDYQLTSQLEQEAKQSRYDADHPHVCSCKRRFATARGLARHVARARYGTHAPLTDVEADRLNTAPKETP